MTAIDRAYQDVNDLIEHLTSGTVQYTVVKYLAERTRGHISQAKEERAALLAANTSHQERIDDLRAQQEYCGCLGAYEDSFGRDSS